VPTRRGVIVLGAGLLLTGLGFGFGYAELVVLGLAAVAGFVGALGFAGWRPRLAVQRTISPERVERGQPCLAYLDVRSTARWRSQSLVGVDMVSNGQPVPVPPIRLRAGAATHLEYPLPTARRGVVEVGPLLVARQDPFGLVRASRRYGTSMRLWVHPRSYPIRSVPVGASRSLDGAVDAVQYGSITFHALREYVPGDDLRHVHWRTSAHVGQLMVREHVDTSLPRLVLLVDDRANAAGPDGARLEEVADAAASVIHAALRAELHVELHLVSGRSVVARPGWSGIGPDGAGATPYLDLLAEAQPMAQESLRPAVRILRGRHRGDTLVLLTGSTDATDLEPVGLLRDAYPTVVVGILGELPQGLAGLPGVITISAPTAAEFALRWDGVTHW